MADQPSPVRASARELPKRDTLALIEALRIRALALTGEKWERQATADMMKEAADQLELLAAEARGRQQAEQERDQAASRLVNVLQDVAALTQALKDYGQHKPECGAGPLASVIGHIHEGTCTCGLDAALTGAQA